LYGLIFGFDAWEHSVCLVDLKNMVVPDKPVARPVNLA